MAGGAFALSKGMMRWGTVVEVFGCWLGYLLGIGTEIVEYSAAVYCFEYEDCMVHLALAVETGLQKRKIRICQIHPRILVILYSFSLTNWVHHERYPFLYTIINCTLDQLWRGMTSSLVKIPNNVWQNFVDFLLFKLYLCDFLNFSI